MIAKTEGIVLHGLKYGDTSLIVRIFTRELGSQSYVVKGVRKAKSRLRQSLFQPLTLLSMEVYHKANSDLQHIREVGISQILHHIPGDMVKTSIVVFLAEILSKTLRNQEPSGELFDFIRDSVVMLDKTEGRIADFHLVFLIRLSRFLGFEPRNNFDENHRYFNLREGLFQHMPGQGEDCMREDLSKDFHAISQAQLDELECLKINPTHRRELLEQTINYFRHHLDGMQEIRSHSVLAMVLGEKS